MVILWGFYGIYMGSFVRLFFFLCDLMVICMFIWDFDGIYSEIYVS